jgi:hypothetical protein
VIAGKLVVFRTPDGDIWPAFRDRLDPLRAERQRALDGALADAAPLLQRIGAEISALAEYIRSGRTDRDAGIVVQQAVGRLFFPDYAADAESHAAASTLSAWLSAGPFKSWRLRRSGALQAALAKITTLARGNTACAHATGLAMENVVKSIGLMRELARSGKLDALSVEEAVAQTLRAPERVLREARDGVRIGNLCLPARSLILFGVEAARRQSRDSGVGFFASAWNHCPARAIVPALLGEVWRTAQQRSLPKA